MKLLNGAKNVDAFLSRIMPLVPFTGLVLGVSFPHIFINIAPIAPILFGTMTLTGALRLKARDLGKAASSPIVFVMYFVTSRVLLPLFVLFFCRLIFSHDPDVISGFVLVYAVPTAVTSFVWVTIIKGDLALVLAFILMDTILAPLIVPATVMIFLGAAISIDIMGMALSLLYMIVIPTIIGISLNEMSNGKVPALIGPWLSPLSKVIIIFVVAANSAGAAPLIRPDNPRVWMIIGVCMCLNIFAFLFGKCVSMLGKLETKKQVAFFLATGLRNNSAAMILGLQFFPAAAVLPSILGILTQHSIAGIMGKILTRKKPPEES